MTIELWALMGAVLLLFVAIFAQQIAMDRIYGAKYALSNRDALDGPVSPVVERLTRLVRNHVEGLAIFGSLVLIANAAEVSNSFTQVAALVIVSMRALHFLFYAFGITPFRSFAWGIGFLLATPAFIYGLVSSVGLPF
ncbi:MAG: MAPEG family protein [Pseudomonadota bacterium]